MTKKEVEAILPKECHFHPIPYGTPEWYRFRATGIGGSDISTIAHINKWGSPMKLYHQKLGTVPQDEDNEAMFHGRMLEPYLANLWEHWGGSPESHMRNVKENRKIRDSIQINGYVSNGKYPWLFASTDRLIDCTGLNKGLNMLTHQPLKRNGILELKTMSFWANRAYDDEVPPYYLTQVQGYMLIMETDYAEIAVLKQGNVFEVIIVEANKEVQEQILTITKHFYDHHLKPGYEAKKKFDQALIENDIDTMERCQAEIDYYEPPPDNSEEYKNFVSDTFRKDREHYQSPPGFYKLAKKAIMLRALINRLELAREGVLNNIRREHKMSRSEYMMYGSDNGYTRYFRKSRNKKYELAVKIKEVPSEERINNEVKKLNIDYG